MNKKTSLRDIARQLQVSVKTVSGALNNSDVRMAEETKQKILTLAEELNYRPNTIARGMRAGVMPIVGMMADGLVTQPFATEILRQFDNRLKTEGLVVVVTNVRHKDGIGKEIRELQRFLPQKIVYASFFHQEIKLPQDVKNDIALMLNCFDPSGDVPSLVPDEFAAGHEAAERVIARGRRRIAYFDLPGIVAGTLREEGVRAAMSEAGLTIEEDWFAPATEGRMYSEKARRSVGSTIERWFARTPAPDAIVCGNDRIAMEAYMALARSGLRIPDDVSAIGFDNQIDIATRLDPPLSTMALPHREIGRLAGDIVIGKKPRPDGIVKVPFRYIERESL